MKRFIITLLCLTTLLTAFIVPFSVSATETWVDVADYWEGGIYHEFGSATGMYQKMQGNFSNSVAPGNAKSFSQVYSGLSKGYVYTIKQSYNVSVQPGGLTDVEIDNSYPCFVTVNMEHYNKAGIGELFPVDTYRKNGDPSDSTSMDATDLFRLSGYISWRNQRATVTYVIEPLSDYFFLSHFWGLGIEFSDGLKDRFSSVVLSGMDIKATKAVTSDTYYQEQLKAMESLESQVQQQGQATVNAIDQNGQQTRQTIDQAKGEITDSIKNQPSNEHQYAEQNKGDTSEIDNLIPEIPLDGTENFLKDVFSTLSTTETQTSITLPAAHVPFCAGMKLWDEQTIDFSPWLSNPNIVILITWWKGIFAIGVVFAIIWKVYGLVLVALGLKRPTEPEHVEEYLGPGNEAKNKYRPK